MGNIMMNLHNRSDEEVLQIATPIMDNLMEASTERNWSRHTKDFTESARLHLTEPELIRQCEIYQSRHGYFADREFLGITRHPQYVNIIWKQKMTKSPGEYLATLTLVQNAEKYEVVRCWVDLWEPKN